MSWWMISLAVIAYILIGAVVAGLHYRYFSFRHPDDHSEEGLSAFIILTWPCWAFVGSVIGLGIILKYPYHWLKDNIVIPISGKEKEKE